MKVSCLFTSLYGISHLHSLISRLQFPCAPSSLLTIHNPTLANLIILTNLEQPVLNNTNSGGLTINDVMMHAGVPNAPFGGVGESGYGTYHGKYGFNAISNMRTVVALPTWLDRFMDFRYPPYSMSTKSRQSIKNSLGFKRGESMEDQVIGRNGIVWLAKLPWVVGLGTLGYLTAAAWTRWGKG